MEIQPVFVRERYAGITVTRGSQVTKSAEFQHSSSWVGQFIAEDVFSLEASTGVVAAALQMLRNIPSKTNW